MKSFMKKCYFCGAKVRPAKCKKEGVELNCMRCTSCKEEYFTSSELIRFDLKTGRRRMLRKFGSLGDSIIMRLPPQVIKKYSIKPGNYALFEERPEGILLRVIESHP